jgi:tetratricopeptide (TPR) repeat protein
MLTDRYGLALSNASADAQEDYVRGSDLALTFYPGAAEAYDRAIAADPDFALAQAGKAQVLMRQGDLAAARAALAGAKEVATRLGISCGSTVERLRPHRRAAAVAACSSYTADIRLPPEALRHGQNREEIPALAPDQEPEPERPSTVDAGTSTRKSH